MRKQRWIKNTIEAAAKTDVKMPWERGARRLDFIARRRSHKRRARA